MFLNRIKNKDRWKKLDHSDVRISITIVDSMPIARHTSAKPWSGMRRATTG